MNPPPPPFQLPPRQPPPPPQQQQQQPPQLSYTPNPFFLPSSTTTTTTTISPDLPTALSTLTSLLHLSNSTLTSHPITPTPTPTLVRCPFNPDHRLPPSSLFSHSLRCPSSPYPTFPSTSLHYPHTLHHPTPTTTPTPTSPLSIPLDTHFPSPSSFFYSDCPAVVTHPNNHPSPPLLTLPPDLLIKCADFDDSNCDDSDKGLGIGCSIGFGFVGLLPSEVWAIRNEVQEWRDYPSSYSYRVLRTILGLNATSLVDFPTWVVVNSVNYGVVIDCAMRDHVLLLFRLCLKAIVDEAIGFGESLFSGDVKEEDDKGVRNWSFRCLVLGRALMWLATQLSVLYGEVNGKHFAISILRQCILDASLGSSIFAESTGSEKVDCGKDEERVEDQSEKDQRSRENGPIGKNMISVSQVAAAVAALHERAMLEEKIRASRDSRPLTAYQRMVEHETVSRMADEERKRRADYQPLIEHDLLLRQHSSNEETNKMKTREEILAEERDYKRRRMSYRGKRLKRSTTEVMRDIIEEYMEEIKQASEVGCSAEGSEKAEALASEHLPVQDNSEDLYKPTKDFDDSSEMSRVQRYSNRRLLDSHYNMQPGESKDFYFEGNKLQRKDSYHGHLESERSIRRPHHNREARSPDERRSRRNRGDNSRSPDRKRSRRGRDDYSRSPNKRWNRRDREDHSRSPVKRRSRRDREDHSRSPDGRWSSHRAFAQSTQEMKHEDLSGTVFSRSPEGKYSGSNKRHGHKREESGRDLELKNKQQGKSHWNCSSASEFQDKYNSIVHDEFEDRYNPSDSHGSYEENR